MVFDIQTMAFILSMSYALQTIVLFTQYRINKIYRGLGWWTLGSVIGFVGFIFNFLRFNQFLVYISIVTSNSLLILGLSLIFIGVMRFLGRRENKGYLIIINTVIPLIMIFFTYINDDMLARRIIISITVALISIQIANNLYIYKARSYTVIANFIALVFYIFSFLAIISAMISFFVNNPDAYLSTIMQASIYLFTFTFSTLWTFGFIMIINQRLNEDNCEAKEYIENVFNTSPDASIIFRVKDQQIIKINEGFISQIGYKYNEIINKSNFILNLYGNVSERERIVNIVNEYGMCSNEEAVFKRKDGSVFTGLLSAKKIIIQDTEYIISNIRDISEKKQLEINLSNEKKLIETTLISVGDGVISTDNNGHIVFLNRIAELLTGWTQNEARGKSIDEVFNIINEFTREKSVNYIKDVLERGIIYGLANHTVLISKDGQERSIEISAAPIVQDNGEVYGVVIVFKDISEKKLKQKEIEYLSYHDQLTGLHNRRYLEEEITKIDEDERYVPLTLIMADVNGLKLTNDAFGHKAGDELLEKIARILKKECRTEDIVSRIGGDEFILLLPKTDALNADKIINRINAAIANEKMENIILSLSLGYAVKNDINDDINEIYRRAEDEMYKNKLFESARVRSKTIELIMDTLYEKNHREMIHSKRVAEICEKIASKIYSNNNDIEQVRLAGLMHDIGKIGIDINILNKPRKLDSEEWNEVERHSEIGYRILSSVNEYSEIAEFVLQHHERYDGKGYPQGLKGDEISTQARIIAIADAYDALTNVRTYDNAINEEDAVKEIIRCSGTQFDPEIARVFVEKVLGKKWE